VEVDEVDSIIITAGADNNSTTDMATTTTIACPMDL
jgi:hypothetical protein